jgi:Tfp pilus assembly protein PilX
MKKITLENNNRNKKKNGFTLLVAMIVTSLILAIGFSIGNIILKELALSASGRRSQIAFYAADSIAECALYWDKKDSSGNSVDNSDILTINESPFATSTTGIPFIQCGSGYGIPNLDPLMGNIAGFSKISDDDGDVQGGTLGLNYNRYATSTFVASFTDPNDLTALACGEVTIAKNINKTVIEARGYNVGYSSTINDGNGGCDISNPKVVERGIKVDY